MRGYWPCNTCDKGSSCTQDGKGCFYDYFNPCDVETDFEEESPPCVTCEKYDLCKIVHEAIVRNA